MITARVLQSAYNDLYASLRNYIWDFETVRAVADLEVATYQCFPDWQSISSGFENLKRKVSRTDAYKSDENLKSRFDIFESTLCEDSDIYANLVTFREVKCHEHEDQ